MSEARLFLSSPTAWKSKVFLGLGAVGLGAGLLAFVASFFVRPKVYGTIFLVAGILLVLALAWSYLIRCPRCNQRWVWHAVRHKDQGVWLIWLLSFSKCENCGYPGVNHSEP